MLHYLRGFIFIIAVLLILIGGNNLSARDTEQPDMEIADVITNAEYEVLDYALSQMLMNREDMGFKKDFTDDDYRLSIVKRHLNDPMSVPIDCDEISRSIHDLPMDLTHFVKKASQLLDVKQELPYNINFSPPLTEPDHNSIPKNAVWNTTRDEIELEDDFINEDGMELLNTAITELVSCLVTSAGMVPDAFGELDDEEMKFLAEYAPVELLHEDIDTQAEEMNLDEGIGEDIYKKVDLDEGIGEDIYENIERLLEDTKLINWPRLYAAGMVVSKSYENFADDVQKVWMEYEIDSYPTGILYDGEVSLGRVVIGGFGNDTYGSEYDDCALIIDFGGDDIYYTRAGCGSLIDEKPVGVVIDMTGNDMYVSRTDFSQGSGFFGIGLLSDWSGDDIYRAGSFSQGAGLFGVGMLIDWGGEDNYSGDTICQGAGAFGIGILCGGYGNDHYSAAYLSQGFGFTLGCGILADVGGHEYYYAGGKYEDFPRWRGQSLSLSQGFGYGIRPVASGGIGILVDGNGNDFYSAEVYGQGVSYWYSLGILADFDGNDKYSATQYAQGSGIHLSVGCLIEHAGNDYYTSWACGQGGAHDLAVGWLLDHAGNDFYTCRDLGLGSGNANAVGVLIDREGEDGYFSKVNERAIASAIPARDYGGIAILIDMAGPDTYSEPLAGDGKVWTKTSWGVGVDVDMEMGFWEGMLGEYFGQNP